MAVVRENPRRPKRDTRAGWAAVITYAVACWLWGWRGFLAVGLISGILFWLSLPSKKERDEAARYGKDKDAADQRDD